MIAARPGRTILQDGDAPEFLTSTRVSADLPQVLGTEPVLGRWFVSEEDVTGTEQVVVLSHDLCGAGLAAILPLPNAPFGSTTGYTGFSA